LLASIVTVRITKPLGVLSDATRKVGDGDLSVRVNMRTGNEFDDLITSFNAMVDELQRRREESERLERERAWREMAKQVAHEIRNPLTPMKLSIQHLQQVFKDQSPDRERLLQEITKTLIEQIESLSHIASEFSMFAKMPEQRFERVNIGEILRQTVQVFSSIQNIHFEITIPEITRDSIADREQLSRAFLNIIKNAVQAMNNGGTISIVVTEEERLSIIKIHDNGPGISQENLKKIFEPNFSTKSEGMGLGLAIARRIIEESGGTVTCESIPGSGTTFTICLPS
ncbi:MAG TPA: ATP-binding protein, partial [Bacteroidota bacterium]|nr:ATP-binding protein [Bacteroidota bacterium]